MTEAEQVSHLISDIYDAAFDPSLWRSALEKTCGFVGGQVAGLLSKDSVSKVGNAHYHHGIDAHYLQLYHETYWRLDPMVPLLFFEVGQVTTIRDYMSDDEFREGRFYREWLQPQSWFDAANVVLDKSVTSCAILSVVRKEASGLVDDEMRRRMRLIVPHIRRAVLIGKVIDLKMVEAASFADTLDGIGAGMFLADAGGWIVHANVSGHALLAAGSVLFVVGRKLAAHDTDAEQALHDVFLAAGNGDAAVGTKGISVPLTSQDGERYVAHVLPLTSGARRRTGASYTAVAALFVHKAVLDTPSAPEVIAKTFKLTPTELRVLLGIVEVGGVAETAEALGIAETTVKTHLRRLYDKTGTGRQAELVKLVAGFSSPLVG